jgi:hypothetical protein
MASRSAVILPSIVGRVRHNPKITKPSMSTENRVSRRAISIHIEGLEIPKTGSRLGGVMLHYQNRGEQEKKYQQWAVAGRSGICRSLSCLHFRQLNSDALSIGSDEMQCYAANVNKPADAGETGADIQGAELRR